MLLQLATHAKALADPEFAWELLTLGFLSRFMIGGVVFLLWRVSTARDGFRPHVLERLGAAVLLLEALHGWIALVAAQSVGAVEAVRWFSWVPMQGAFVAVLLGSVLRARRDAPDGRIPRSQLLISALLAVQVAFTLFAV